MKKSFLFLPFMAALVLAGCSSDDEPAPVGDSGTADTEVTAAGYVAVNIVQPASAGPRAAAAGYEEGSTAENSAARGVFCVVKADGTFNGGAQVISLDKATPSTGTSPEVEQIYKAVLVLEGEKNADGSSAIDADEILCILNAPVELVAKLTGTSATITTKDQLLAEIGSYDAAKDNNFIMTNSTYIGGGNTVCGAKVKTGESGNIKPSAAEALANPVEIYVERVVAKVRAKKGDSFTNSGASTTVNGTTSKTFSIKINGIAVANIPNQYYMFKNIEGIATPLNGWTWNNFAEFRSHWGNTPVKNTEFAYDNVSYNDFTTIDITTAAAGTELLMKYVNPNTSSQYMSVAGYENTTLGNTAIMVSAQLMDGTEPADLVYLRGGYFDSENAKNLVAQYVRNNHYVMMLPVAADGSQEYKEFDASYFTWINKVDDPTLTFLKGYEVVPQLRTVDSGIEGENYWNGDIAVYNPATDTYSKVNEGGVAAVQSLLKGTEERSLYKARVFTEGRCYYFVNIDQSRVLNSSVAEHLHDGVVRNHIYDLSINSIAGIGVPVFDPTDVIIPETPTDVPFEYLAATVNVLDWKVVSQGVDFQGQ